MEILAVVEALSQLQSPCEVELYSDSKYVCDSIEKRWVWGWQKKGWIKSDKKPALNVDLWKRLLPLLSTHKVRMRWLKGHDAGGSCRAAHKLPAGRAFWRFAVGGAAYFSAATMDGQHKLRLCAQDHPDGRNH